jgi:hypothetical protein
LSMLVDPFRLLKKDVRKPRKKYLRNLCGVLNPSTYMCWPQAISVNMCTILGPDPLALELKNVPQTWTVQLQCNLWKGNDNPPRIYSHILEHLYWRTISVWKFQSFATIVLYRLQWQTCKIKII